MAAAPAVFVDAELKRTPARLVGLSDGVLRHYDAQRVLRETPTRRVVRLEFLNAQASTDVGVDDATAEPDLRRLVLTDGQRVAGRPDGAAADGDALRWRHLTLGVFTVALENIRAIEGVDAGLVPRHGDVAEGDTIRLDNGDALAGFVARVTEAGVELETENGNTVELAWDQIDRLTLANPGVEPTGRADVVSFVDGTRLRCDPARIEGDTLWAAPHLASGNPKPRPVPLSVLQSVGFAASGYRLLEVAVLPMEVAEPARVYGLPYAPRVTERGLLLHAPVVLRFTLPTDTVSADRPGRFAAVAEWPALQRHGATLRSALSAELVIEAGDRPTRVDLRPGDLEAFNMPLSADAFTLSLQPGPAGPALGRVWLRDARVLVPLPEEPRSASVP